MDMRMPNVDGIEATEQISKAPWAMPVVVLSAYDEPQMIEAALAAGATNCLKKGVGLFLRNVLAIKCSSNPVLGFLLFAVGISQLAKEMFFILPFRPGF